MRFPFWTKTQRLKGGSTAVVSLIRGNLLLTAWLGDSQAVLVKDGVATQLVNPHKPDRSVSYFNSHNKTKTHSLVTKCLFGFNHYRTKRKGSQILAVK